MKLKKDNLLKTLLLAMVMTSVATLAAGTASAQYHPAYDTFSVTSGSFYLSSGETRSVSLPGWHYVQKVIIRAQSASHWSSRVLVWANGDVKGTVYLPGTDPSYVVTIAATVNKIQFQSLDNSAWIMDVQVIGRPIGSPYFDEGYNPLPAFDGYARNDVASLAMRTIRIVDGLERYTNYTDYGVFLLPIKKQAARVYSLAQAGGTLSLTIRDAVITLIAQVQNAEEFINESYEVDAAFQLTVDLRTTQEHLKRLLY